MRFTITAGGLGTIVAVLSILFFLLYVVEPLFRGVTVARAEVLAAAVPDRSGTVLASGVDEDGLVSWSLLTDGRLRSSRLDTGATVDERVVLDPPPCAAAFGGGPLVAFGFDDGTLRTGRLEFEVRFVEPEDLPEQYSALASAALVVHQGAVLTRTGAGQLRSVRPVLALADPLATGDVGAVQLLDCALTPGGPVLVALHEGGRLRSYRVLERTNMMTGETILGLRTSELPLEPSATPGADRVWISGLGTHVYLTRRDGRLLHFDLRDPINPVLHETVDVLPEADAQVSSQMLLLGRTTLLIADSLGRVTTWFPVRPEHDEGASYLVRARELRQAGEPVVCMASSSRARLVATGTRAGQIELFHVTSGSRLLAVDGPPELRAIVLAPKDDALLAFTGVPVARWAFDKRFPEASMAALFAPVWYEGYREPSHSWESSSATDDTEPKLGMMPLVFGTLKATLYSMIFGAPLALLAAIFSSEFLAPGLRSRLKAIIELMASLPSVVLGFVGALVIAPFIEGLVMEVLLSFYCVPVALLVGAHAWQMLPAAVTLRAAGLPRFLCIASCVPLGVTAAALIAPRAESLLFGSDLTLWLSSCEGSAFGGLLYLLVPLAALLVTLGVGRFVGPRLRQASATWSRERCARADLIKFAGAVSATIVVAAAFAGVLSAAGVDARGGVTGDYVQRNAMVVGFVMGFAIIPIIYTLAEDSLSEVPTHLREGSLGAGATQWQTAVRIVIPAAMSGLFSAVMIGLGRAVGETMIVLMAAGNTAILDINPFNGFRTLSANIATELPEAVRHSAHYRTLFLAALVLFAMTFVLNTFAEVVRRHFRAKTRAL